VAETLQPTTAEELRDVVQAALAEKKPLEIVGRGSKRGFGRPVEAEMAVGLGRFSGIEMYEPEELVMTAGAGTPLAEIERVLADNQQQLAFEPADYGRLLGGETDHGSIGGVFACNLSGPRRLKAGAARDHFLGVTAVTGRGDLIKSGGRVMKNVTGYDLCKLFAGSFGTLAAMTRVSFKVLPAPESTVTLALAGLEPEQAHAALREAVGSAYDIAGAGFLSATGAGRSATAAVRDAGAALALLRIEGARPSVDYRLDALQQLLKGRGADVLIIETEASLALWREIRDVALLPAEATLIRVSVPPMDGPTLIEALGQRFDADAMTDWAGGLVWLALETADEDAVATMRDALPAGAHATLVRADEALRTAVPVFQPQPDPLARLTQRVKDSFDPERILNPGRMVEGL
jgi:glycolate oxidase FAD binding subunit